MAYATPTDFLNRVDVRRLGDLDNDTGTRDTPTQVLTNLRIQEALDDAAGMIDAALLKAGRYQPSDLLNLATTTTFGNSLLIRINVNLAYGLLLESRGFTADESPAYTKAMAYLGQLEEGEWIFGIAPVVNAGRTGTTRLSANVVLLTTAARRYFGRLGYQYQGNPPGLTPGMDLNNDNRSGPGPG